MRLRSPHATPRRARPLSVRLGHCEVPLRPPRLAQLKEPSSPLASALQELRRIHVRRLRSTYPLRARRRNGFGVLEVYESK
jgi:hypothetical protein